MTMINPPPPLSHSISKQNRYGGGYGCGSCGDVMNRFQGYECCLRSDLLLIGGPMAEDESRTESTTANEEGSSSKGGGAQEDQSHHGWLQLGIGVGSSSSSRLEPTPRRVDVSSSRDSRLELTPPQGGRLVELDLLRGGRGRMRSSPPPPPPPVSHHVQNPRPNLAFSSVSSSSFLLPYDPAGTSLGFPYHQQKVNNWGSFRPNFPQNMMMSSTSTSSASLLLPTGSYFGRPFQIHGGVEVGGGGGGAGPSSDFLVIDPPRRPHSGLWFMLQASQNQSKEPFLPQIPKSYLRIKDGRMTVRLLMKYLVNKLRLDNESEIEITCRGQQLLPFLTLQHVRDHIWTSSNSPMATAALTLLADSPTTDHVMVLNYARSNP